MVGMADKAQEDIQASVKQSQAGQIRKEFWSKLIHSMNSSNTNLYQNINPSVYHWIGAGSGVRGVGLNFVTTKTYARAELYIDRGDKDENKFVYDELLKQRENIEAKFGKPLEWERLDDRRASRVKIEQSGNVFEKEQWNEMVSFMTEAMCKLESALKEPVNSIGSVLKNKS